MTFDTQKVEASFAFDPDTVAHLRQSWLKLLDTSVWGDVTSTKIGAVARMRKRLLEVGENMRSVTASRDWIPHPREQLKSGLGASVKLRDSLLGLERAAATLEGGEDFKDFEAALLTFRRELLMLLEQHEAWWAELLDSQYDEEE